jgi:hypothetical protein
MVGVGLGGINRANFCALRRVEMSHALYALRWVYNVSSLALANCVHRAFWLTGSAADALVRNLIRHVFPPEFILEKYQ